MITPNGPFAIRLKTAALVCVLVVASTGTTGVWTYWQLHKALLEGECAKLAATAESAGRRFAAEVRMLREQTLLLAEAAHLEHLRCAAGSSEVGARNGGQTHGAQRPGAGSNAAGPATLQDDAAGTGCCSAVAAGFVRFLQRNSDYSTVSLYTTTQGGRTLRVARRDADGAFRTEVTSQRVGKTVHAGVLNGTADVLITFGPSARSEGAALLSAATVMASPGEKPYGVLAVQRELRAGALLGGPGAKHRTLQILGSDAAILSAGPPGAPQGSIDVPPEIEYLVPAIGKAADASPARTLLHTDARGRRFVRSFFRLGIPVGRQSRPLTFITSERYDDVLGRSHAARNACIAAGLLVVLVSGGFGLMLARLFARPLETITQAIEAFGREGAGADLPMHAPGEAGRVAHVFQDMMQQVRERTDRRFRDIVEASADALVGVDAEGTIILANPKAETLFGRTREELVGRPVEILVPEELRQAHREHVRGFFKSPRNRPMEFGSEFYAVRKDGTRFPAEIGLSAVETDNGKMGVAAVRDISARKAADATIKQIESQLRQSQKLEAVGALAGGVAHEFNNLLQAIQGYTKYAMDGLDTEGQRYQDLQQVETAAHRAATLTRQLLGFGRRQTMRIRSVEINDVVTDTQKMLRPVIGEHIELDICLQPDLSSIVGDPAMLQQVLLNLCLNARDAMPQGGQLLIKTEQVYFDDEYCIAHPGMKLGTHVQLSVTDTGAGMTKDVVQHIFEPFFTTKGVGQGTGLGLAMVYGIVQQHGGLILVDSQPDRGTTFKLSFPGANVELYQEGESARDPAPGGSETILVAEDEPMVRSLLTRVLQGAGYSVLQAADGHEAKCLFNAHADIISLALLDAVMPKASGRDVCEHIRSIRPEVRVVFCTGYDPHTGHDLVVDGEQQRLIQKPVDPEALLHTVREVLESEVPCQVLQPT